MHLGQKPIFDIVPEGNFPAAKLQKSDRHNKCLPVVNKSGVCHSDEYQEQE